MNFIYFIVYIAFTFYISFTEPPKTMFILYNGFAFSLDFLQSIIPFIFGTSSDDNDLRMS